MTNAATRFQHWVSRKLNKDYKSDIDDFSEKTVGKNCMVSVEFMKAIGREIFCR